MLREFGQTSPIVVWLPDGDKREEEKKNPPDVCCSYYIHIYLDERTSIFGVGLVEEKAQEMISLPERVSQYYRQSIAAFFSAEKSREICLFRRDHVFFFFFLFNILWLSLSVYIYKGGGESISRLNFDYFQVARAQWIIDTACRVYRRRLIERKREILARVLYSHQSIAHNSTNEKVYVYDRPVGLMLAGELLIVILSRTRLKYI